MPIPKIKLYRLDQNYDPTNDNDIKTISDDEIYPVIEKTLSLTQKETLVGVEFKDLMVCKQLPVELETSAIPVVDNLSEAVSCLGWRLGNLKVKFSVDGGTNWSGYIPENCFRVERTVVSTGEGSQKIQNPHIQIRLGNLLKIADGFSSFFPSGATTAITHIKIFYFLFSDDLVSEIVSSQETFCLPVGKIYDGRAEGRASYILSDGGVSACADEDGFPLKVEGNRGYKLKLYPCRQLVAQSSTMENSVWARDLEISPQGKIEVTNCSDWILSQTDKRKPKLFQKVTASYVFTPSGSSVSATVDTEIYHELEITTQYTCSLTSDSEGNPKLTFQLSPTFYGSDFPKEIFIRYNQEEDLMPDLFSPNYLRLQLKDQTSFNEGKWEKVAGTDDGSLSLDSLSGIYSKREFVLLKENPSSQGEISFTWNENEKTCSFEIPEDAENLRIYEDGELIYDGDLVPEVSERWKSFSISDSTFSLTLAEESSKPSSILLSYGKLHSFKGSALYLTEDETVQSGKFYFTKQNGEIIPYPGQVGETITSLEGAPVYERGENPWAVGWRVCAYEKVRKSNLFVSSYRNWVSDHLNNNPDIFQGYTTYDGSVTNPTGINYVSGGYSILHQEGAVSFASPVEQNTFEDIKNWPPSNVSLNYSNIDLEAVKLASNMVYAKFAYLDGIYDLPFGLLRKISSIPNAHTYAVLEDPGNPLENKKWLIRNDSKMPTIFKLGNQYLPVPSSSEEFEDTEVWTEDILENNKFLQMQFISLRPFVIKLNFQAPQELGRDGQTQVVSGYLSWEPHYDQGTSLLTEAVAGSILFPVRAVFTYSSETGFWNQTSERLEVYTQCSKDSLFEPVKEYFKFSNGEYVLDSSVTVGLLIPEGEYFTKQEIPISSREITDSSLTLETIFSNRGKIEYLTDSSIPYNLVFQTGDNGLMVYAKNK